MTDALDMNALLRRDRDAAAAARADRLFGQPTEETDHAPDHEPVAPHDVEGGDQ